VLEGAWRALNREADLVPLEEKVDRLSREVLVYAAKLPEDALALPLLKAASKLEHWPISPKGRCARRRGFGPRA